MWQAWALYSNWLHRFAWLRLVCSWLAERPFEGHLITVTGGLPDYDVEIVTENADGGAGRETMCRGGKPAVHWWSHSDVTLTIIEVESRLRKSIPRDQRH